MCVPNVGLTGSTYNWAHNLFILWVLNFLLWVILHSETQSLIFVFACPSFSHKATPLSFGIVPLLSMCSPQNCQPPHLNPFSPLFSSRWVEVSDYSLTYVNGGPIPSFLSGRSIGKGGNGIGTDSHLQKPARQRYSHRHYWATEYRVSPSNDTPDQVEDDQKGLAVGVQDSAVSSQLLGPDWSLRCPDLGYRPEMGMGRWDRLPGHWA